MTNTDEMSGIEEARTANLRRIGRNLVNVQRIEQMLKFLLQASFTNPLRGLEVHYKTHVEKVARKTLGALIPDLAEVAFSAGGSVAAARYANEVWIKTSINVPLDAEAQAAWRQEWETLRVERNKLVHLMLAKVDFNSPEQCQKLDPELDAQNVLFLNSIAFLGPIVTATQAEIARIATGELELCPLPPDASQG
jgi:hypothetical protein